PAFRSRAFAQKAKTSQANDAKDQDHQIWLPHHLLPWGSPVFYVALVLVPLLCIYNEMQDKKLEELNQEMREERLRRRAERLKEAE
ncbi:Hypothetical protein SCF082_LOCUS10986, partial [Durusdinium trenchii]